MSEKPLVSIVTVCYNAKDCIKTTIESVIKQTNLDYEYIIVDGLSTDGTTEIIRNNISHFPIEIKVKYISECDKGIYDAMNKAIHLAEGEWIIFMNAGDGFYNNQILQDIIIYLKKENDIVYGDQCWVEENNTAIRRPGGADKLTQGATIFHQSAFVRSELLRKNPFSLEYKIAGDYESFLKLYLKGFKFFYIPITIANFAYGGISSTYALGCLKENTNIRKKYGCIDTHTLKFKYWYVKEYCYLFIKSHIPRNLDLKIIKWKANLCKDRRK